MFTLGTFVILTSSVRYESGAPELATTGVGTLTAAAAPAQVTEESPEESPAAAAAEPASAAHVPPEALIGEEPVAVDTASGPPDKVIDYLWSVYQRSPLKRDGHGEFTWKDVSAAERLGLSLRDYVIGGMDPDFREQLYRAGLAMDAAGIDWTILSGFRDDYRQIIASGFKAQPGNSFHGGSVATGGYAHGCAVDIASVDKTANPLVWRWLDLHGSEFGLQRPLSHIDPPHVQPLGLWHELAAKLRAEDGRPQPEPAAAIPAAASNGEAPAETETHRDCTKPRLAVADKGEPEPAPAPRKWGRVLSLHEPRALVAPERLESRWSRSHGKWHLKVTAARHDKPGKATTAAHEKPLKGTAVAVHGKQLKGAAAAHDKSLKIAAQEKPRGSSARKKPAPADDTHQGRRQAARRPAKQQG